jgi:hypothetical protein
MITSLMGSIGAVIVAMSTAGDKAVAMAEFPGWGPLAMVAVIFVVAVVLVTRHPWFHHTV